MSLIPRKSRLVKNAEVINGNKRDMRKKVIKSTTKDSDLKRAISKKENGGLASFIELEETPISFTPTEFSEYNFPLSNTYIDIKQKEQPIEFEEESTTSSKYVPLNDDKKQSSTISFDKLIDEVSQGNESVKNLKKFLTETARVESNFDFKVQNKAGAPAYGAFQFMDFNIKPLGVSIEEFRNNPKLQIEAAAKLAEQFKSQFTEEDRRLAKEKGYSENALLAGAWLGGVGGVRKVLRGEGNPSDKHWSKEGKGTTVKDRMDKFNKMQEGGVLKCQTGDKFVIPEYGSEEDFDKFILATEKFEPKTYRDAKGHLTIGYGLRQTYDKDLNPTPVKLGQTITEEEARIQHERRKQLDLRQIKKRLSNFDLYPKGLQYAIRDMVFNSGETSTFNPNTKFMKALKGYDSSGDYSNWNLIRGIAKHIDWNLDTEGNLGVRAGMRRAMATEIYDWDDNKTINKYHTNPKDKNYYVNSPYWQFGQLNPKTKGNKIKSRQLGGVLKCQDGKKVDPTILEYWKKQNVVLPEPRHEQVNVDNRTKELKEAQEKDANTRQLGNIIKDAALNTAEGITSMVYPYVGAALSLKNAYTNPDGAYIDAAGTILGGASKPISKLINKSSKRLGSTDKALKNIFDKSHGASIEDYPTEVRLGLLESKGKIKTARDFYNAFDQAEDKTWNFLTDGTISDADRNNRELYKRIYKRDDLKDITGDRIDEYLKSVEPGVYKGEPNEGAQYRHDTKEMQLNLNSPQTYDEAIKSLEHEYRHHGYYGAATTFTSNRAQVNKFYDMKNKRLWRKDIPEGDYEYLSNAEEGYNKAIDAGKDLGVKLGQQYPGADKFLEMLNNYKGNEGFVIRAFDKSTKPRLKRIWNAITGQYVFVPVTVGSALNNKKE